MSTVEYFRFLFQSSGYGEIEKRGRPFLGRCPCPAISKYVCLFGIPMTLILQQPMNYCTYHGVKTNCYTIDDKPSSLPRYRRRKGNIRGPAPRGLDISQTPDQQPQCLLLQTLPPELRLVIWERVLGGLRLHIIQRSKRRLGCVICPRKDTCDICRGVLQQPVKSAETCSKVNLISLLVTCKQM